jgi:hypothetical protein
MNFQGKRPNYRFGQLLQPVRGGDCGFVQLLGDEPFKPLTLAVAAFVPEQSLLLPGKVALLFIEGRPAPFIAAWAAGD